MNGFEFGSSAQFKFPVGSIIQSPATISDPSWLRCDGSIITRSTYPALSAIFGGGSGVGTFTPTVRSLAAVPIYNAIASNGTNLVTFGVSGVSAIQVSTNNGVTWATQTTPSTYGTGQILYTGTNFFALVNTSSTTYGLISPSSTGLGTWTTATLTTAVGATAACNTSGTIIVPVGGSAAYQVSTNYGSTFASATSAGVLAASTPVVWTGTQFICFNCSSAGPGIGMQTSSTGLSGSWTAAAFVPWSNNAIANAVSDGAGNVLATISGSTTAWVSNNNGTTWRQTILPKPASVGANSISYANGRWFVTLETPTYSGILYQGDMAVSSDLNSWTYVCGITQATTNTMSVAYAGGNYCNLSVAGLVTATENTAQMYLPKSNIGYSPPTATVQQNGNPVWQEWIKVQ